MRAQVRGFRGERWWAWVALGVLSATILWFNALTVLFNHIMPRALPLSLPMVARDARTRFTEAVGVN